MSYSEKLKSLLDTYQRERRKLISAEAFDVLVQAFPAVLVAQADGFTDTSEVQRLEEIITFLCKIKGIPMQVMDWTAELRYLAADADYWRGQFLDTLKALLKENPPLYHQQAEFIYAVAVASSGDVVRDLMLRLQRRDLLPHEKIERISEKEFAEIERLIQELDFASVPEALSYLRNLLTQANA